MPRPMPSPAHAAPASAALLFLAVLPFWSNYLVRTYAWIVLLNREGLITGLARWIGYRGRDARLLYTESAVVIGLSTTTCPSSSSAAMRPCHG